MKKILFFLLFTLFFTGCDITYNLSIDDYYNESVSATENNQNNWNYTFGNLTISELKDYYLKKEIPYHFNDPYMAERFERIEGVSYYDVKDLSDDKQIGLSLSARFEDSDSFSKSNLLWRTCKNKAIVQNDDKISINVSGFKVFDEYKTLDKVTINIKSDYTLVSGNADVINKNIYTWVITRDDYSEKAIDISFKISDDLSENMQTPMFRFTICLLLFCFISLIVYLFIKIIFNKKNSF